MNYLKLNVIFKQYRCLHSKNLSKITALDSKILFENRRKPSHMSGDAHVINGRAHAAKITAKLKARVSDLKLETPGFRPKLAVLQIGSLPDSSVYVRVKQKAAEEIGIQCEHIWLPEQVSEKDLLDQIDRINADASVHGLIVQLPLPTHLDELRVSAQVAPEKDVDGFHPLNIGNLTRRGGVPHFVACTPRGVLELLERENVNIAGARCVIVGRSNIVGIPLFQLMLSKNATPTLCHKQTQNLKSIVKEADILVVAAGEPELVKGDWIKPGAVVVDVGINPIPDSSKKSGFSYIGDVEFSKAVKTARLITPVPGGVGPMTVTMLLDNTIKAAIKSKEHQEQ